MLTSCRACSRSTKRASSLSARLIAALAAILICGTTMGFTSCVGKDNPVSTNPKNEKPAASDYSKKANWLSLPDRTKPYDTFYIYPSAYEDYNEGAPVIGSIGDKGMHAGAHAFFEEQATAYENSTNVFAPYYRQMNFAAVMKATAEERNKILSGVPLQDLYAALDYYFEHYNEGRPFILAGHSQGSQMLTYILSEYMSKHPKYYKRMIAAYVIGYSITDSFLAKNKHLKFAEKADDTGVIISWNTEGPGNKNQKNFVVVDGAISINPLNWKRDDTYAPASENLGARFKNQTTGKFEIIPEAADAKVDTERGVVVTTTKVIDPIDDTLGMGFGPDSFHHADYSLYYNNIKANVAERCAAYQK